MRTILTFILVGLFSVGLVAQERPRTRHVFRPVIRVIRPLYQPYHQRAVKVVVYLDSYGNVLHTDTHFASNLYVNENFIAEARRRAANKHYKPTGRNRKKTVYIYFTY